MDVPDRHAGRRFETVPLVVDGIMYFTAGEGTAFAIDARSGRQLWRYKHAFPPGRKVSGVNRGLAILGNLLYMVTIDSHLVALDAATGKPVWDTEMVPYIAGTYYATHRAAGGEGQGDRRASAAASRACAASWTPTTPRPASAPGASGPCPGRASPAPIVGRRLLEDRRRLPPG